LSGEKHSPISRIFWASDRMPKKPALNHQKDGEAQSIREVFPGVNTVAVNFPAMSSEQKYHP
jgi:hypothetical protein